MKYLAMVILASSLLAQPIYACNMCGCSSGNQYIGLLPQNSKSFVGLQYIYRSFSSIAHADDNTAMQESSREYYHTAQLWTRANIGKRWQVLAFVPFMYNRQQQQYMTTETSGLGDISVIGNYNLINTGTCACQHKLFAGGGIKLPTGKYDPASVTEDGLPNMQPGTHSWDFITNVNYTIRYNAAGINTDASYVITTANPDNYKFGNRLSIGATAFYEYTFKKLSVIPQAGIRHDRVAKDYEDYTAREKDEDGGGWQLYATQGVQLYYRRLGFQAMCYEPISQHYASGMVNTRLRVESGIVLLMK